MSDIHILETEPAEPGRLLNAIGDHFIKDTRLAVRLRFDCWEAVGTIEDLANAGRPGKTCPRITIKCKHLAHNGSEGINALMRIIESNGNSLKRTFDAVMAMPFPVPAKYCGPQIDETRDGVSVTFYLWEEKGTRTFSPFAEYSRLPAAPAQWTVAHVVRALWNGQFRALKCNGHYTDDYAWDAAVNFGIGAIKDGRHFARRLIESPSGWWASVDRGGSEVSICCHHFDSNSFTFDIDGRVPVEPTKELAEIR